MNPKPLTQGAIVCWFVVSQDGRLLRFYATRPEARAAARRHKGRVCKLVVDH